MPMPTQSPPPQSPWPPPFGVYVHFPYCQQKCPYCDFAVAVRKQIPHQRYLRALTCELQAKAALFPDRRAISVYFGGGTPSLWQVDCLAAALRTILAAFPPPAGLVPEVTVECDPHGTTLAQLQALRSAGVNRLSIGAQSLQPRHLITLGRQHTPQEIPQVVEHARAAGFANLSLDLMIGLCGQRRDELAADLEGLLALTPEHVSLYQLTVEPGTPLAASIKRGTQTKPSDDDQADAYEQVRSVLSQSGYQHYEISSFCKVPTSPSDDFAARHNRLYWTGGEYLGLGVSAHSFRHLGRDLGGERFANTRSTDEYLTTWAPAQKTAPASVLLTPTDAPSLQLHEHRAPDDLAKEAVWLGLRALQGLSCSQFLAMHGLDPRLHFAAPIASMVQRGWLQVDGDLLRLTTAGVLFADEVGACFL